jgi:hypothetical protein
MQLAHRLLTERTKAPDSITVTRHDNAYREVAARLRAQSPLPLEGPLGLGDVVRAYRDFAHRPGQNYDAHVLFEEAALICGWAGDVEQARALISEGARLIAAWPPEVCQQIGDVEAWQWRLHSAVAQQEHLRGLADEQAQALGAEALPRAPLHVV